MSINKKRLLAERSIFGRQEAAFYLLRAWADAFQTFDWEKAIPVPDLATKQITQLLALV